jgi:hypothetical protein
MTEKIQLAKKGTQEMTVFSVMSRERPVLRFRILEQWPPNSPNQRQHYKKLIL